jgi:hypothetical protein
MPLLSASGSKLWMRGAPRPLVAKLALDPSHWAFRYLICAIVPSDGSNKPVIFLGPQASNWSAFPSKWASGGLNSNIMGATGPGLSFSGASASQILLTANADFFSGMSNFTFIGRFQNNSSAGVNDDVFRKDGSFSPVQFSAANTLRCAIFLSGTVLVSYINNIGVNDVMDAGVTVSGATTTSLYQSLNGGVMALATDGTGGGVATGVNATTPLCLGGNESGGEFFTGNIFYGYWFNNIVFNGEQVASFFNDPGQIFLPSEPELAALFLASGLILNMQTVVMM